MRVFIKILTIPVILYVLTACSSFSSEQKKQYTVTAITSEDAERAARILTDYRAAKGLSAVRVDERLNKAAAVQAERVVRINKLDHGNLLARVRQAEITAAAENLSAGDRNVDEAMETWKNSPYHNKNLLLPEMTRIGLARADNTSPYRMHWVLVLAD